MINGYFGPRLLHPHGFAEHKIDIAGGVYDIATGKVTLV